jgi:hypothetical protein
LTIENKIKSQVNHWRLYAKVLPLSFLALLFLQYMLGFDTIVEKTLVCGGTIMFSSAVIWWYWALHKIYTFAGTLNETSSSIDKIANEIKDIKKTIIADVGDRER